MEVRKRVLARCRSFWRGGARGVFSLLSQRRRERKNKQTFSLILSQSKLFKLLQHQTNQSLYHSFPSISPPFKTNDSNFLHLPKVTPTLPRESFVKAELTKIKDLKFGKEVGIEGEIKRMGLFERWRDWSLRRRGKFERVVIELSDRSRVSRVSRVTPKFSMAGILCPLKSSSLSLRGFKWEGVFARSSASNLMFREI